MAVPQYVLAESEKACVPLEDGRSRYCCCGSGLLRLRTLNGEARQSSCAGSLIGDSRSHSDSGSFRLPLVLPKDSITV